MQRVSLAASGLGIAEEEILRLFEPFVDRALSDRPGAWQDEVGRRKRKLLERTAKRLLMPWRGAGRLWRGF